MARFTEKYGFIGILCLVGGANLEILKKCPAEKNEFTAIGVGIFIISILSIITMWVFIFDRFNNVVLSLFSSIFYGFSVFIGYWGFFSIKRKSKKNTAMIKMIGFLIILFMSMFPVLATQGEISFLAITYFLLSMMFYSFPIILKYLIGTTTYEEEVEKMEHNLSVQTEADKVAYSGAYQRFANTFNDANIKMELIKQMSDLTKEYYEILETMRKETFSFINSIDKHNRDNIFDEIKTNILEQHNKVVAKISHIYKSIHKIDKE